MVRLIRADHIDELMLSTRANNALIKLEIKTIGDLIDFPKEKILKAKNIGFKSFAEIMCAINQIELFEIDSSVSVQSIEQTDTALSCFIGLDGQLYRDTSVEDLGLSIRACNGLKSHGIEFASKLMDMKDTDFLEIPHLGVKSVREIIEAKNHVEFQLAPSNLSDTANTSKIKDDEFCRLITQEIVQAIDINGGKLYEAIYPLLEKHEGSRIIDTKNIEIDRALLQEIYSLPIIRNALCLTILEKFFSYPYGLEKSELTLCFPQILRNVQMIARLLDDMVEQSDLLCLSDQLYIRKYPTVLEYVESLEKEQHRSILIGRLNGETLEEIGNACGLTRERVRQVESKILHNAPRLMEDKYANVYEKYNISKEDFLLGFSESEITYNYLSNVYMKGSFPINKLAQDFEFSSEFRNSAERVIYKNYVVLGSERILLSRPELSEYIIRNAGNEGLTFKEFSQLYQLLLNDLNLQDDPKFSVMERGYLNRLAASKHILWKYGQKFRFYNIAAYDYNDLLNTINLNSYVNIELSTRKFFLEYSELMRDYELRDEYELHNLLKKICSLEEFPQVHFKRMPSIEIGEADRDTQVLDLLLSLAPITNADFALAYEHEYGILSQTVLANYMRNFDQYFYGGMYKIDSPILPDIIASKMKQLLDKEFYCITEIRELYVREFPGSDSKLLNPFTLKGLGFRVYSNYVIKDKYTSSSEYFREILTTSDIVDTQVFSKPLLSTQAYTSEVYKQKSTYNIIEFSPQKYINIRKLNQVGVNIETLCDYCRKVNLTSDLQYFTIYSLREKGFRHQLDVLGFDEWFYASILSEDKEHFSCRRIGKNKLFRLGNKEVLLADFFEWIVYSSDSLTFDVLDLVEKLSNEYNIVLEWHKIVETIKGTEMYYDNITGKIYADYNVYFESI